MIGVLLLASVSLSWAVSSGQVDICNALSTSFGCLDFKDGRRNACQEKGRIMSWVTKPVLKADWYKLYAGEDEDSPVTSYVPGQQLKINLRVLEYDKQYRGLLLYAIQASDLPVGYPAHTDGDPAKVGQFLFNDREQLFHAHCPRTVLHADGSPKPYHSSFQFQAPSDITGDIMIVALIKFGPANMGEFYYPNLLTLKQATAPAKPQELFYKGELGQSCDEVCGGKQMLCDNTGTNAVDSYSGVLSAVEPNVLCAKPAVLRCGAEGLSASDDNLCYYRNDALCAARKLDVGDAVTCAAKSSDPMVGHRICKCKCDGEKGPCATTTTTTTTTATLAPTTASVAPPATDAPASCSGQSGACCKDGTTCLSASDVCTAGRCVKKTVCVYGDAGCPCGAGATPCGSKLECVTMGASGQGVCAVKQSATSDFCANMIGQAGCWCTNADGCVASNLTPLRNQDNACYCAVAIAASDMNNICVRGNLGCPCDKQKCSNNGRCELVGQSTICVEANALDVSSASAFVVSLAALVGACLAQLL